MVSVTQLTPTQFTNICSAITTADSYNWRNILVGFFLKKVLFIRCVIDMSINHIPDTCPERLIQT